jgi:hypothetical protein
MNKKIFGILLMTLPVLGKAQLNINIQMPPAGLVQKEQLWNLVLVNNGTDLLDVTLQLNIQDGATGQSVLTATTGNLLLSKGVKMIKAGDVQPVTYTYNLPDFARSYLPMGTYIACYQVINSGARKETPIAEDCIRFNVDPLSPPLLSSPADKSTIESPYPQFTWMPPMPFDMFTSLGYDLLVTEVLEGQSSSEAIQYNSPVYEKSNLSQPYEPYATSFTKLDTGKLYAWQVVAKNGLNYAAKTEIWTFKIAPPSWVRQLIEQTPYLKMKRDNPEKGIAPNGILKMSYTNETADTSVMVHLEEVNSLNKEDVAFEMKINRGENLLQKDIHNLIQTKDGIIYKASIINTRSEIWQMLFEIREYKDKKTERN